MPDFDVNDLGSVGLVLDQPAYQQVPEAWTFAENVRFHDNAAKKLLGWDQIFGTPGGPPHFAMYLVDTQQTWWLYASLTNGYVWDGTTHTKITRQSVGVDVPYTTVRTRDWNGTILGGIPILNDGADVPQFWAAYSAAQKLQDLTAWPGTLRAAVVRAFGPFLVAVNCTKGGVVHPHLVKWSHPAAPGALPISWDETDPTKDAGEYELPDAEAGLLMNALPLRGQMYLYKEAAVWSMRLIGGQEIFSFNSFIDGNGIIGPRAVCLTPDGTMHACFMQDDVIVHDGQQQKSVLTGRMRRYLANSVDRQFYRNSFCFANPQFNEVWICYPTAGHEDPNRALIVQMDGGKTSEATIDFRNASVGAVDVQIGGIAWNSLDPLKWNQALVPWDGSNRDRRRVVVCAPDASQFRELDTTNTRAGVAFTSTIQRVGISFIGRKRDGSPIVEFKQEKLYQRVWLKARGDVFQVRLGTQDTVDGSVRWGDMQDFDPATDLWLDFLDSGRAISVEFSSKTDVDWQVDGYKIEIAPLGIF